ncbi:MAG: ATP-binding cassette domain-containing protein [Acidobacteria bacterium]|nr:ATP-binding cassette domain-containing protein [Acidobacteriota bacterium]
MPSTDVVISLRNVHKDYRGLRPLRVKHLELRQGESVALMGFDHVGAEVLVNLITGATLPDAGDVDVFGEATGAITDADTWLTAAEQFGILSDRIVLLESFSVEQNLALPLSMELDALPPAVRATVGRIAEEVGVAQQLSQAAGHLDAASQMRVRLGKALALSPRVLLVEHPNVTLPATEQPRFAADLAGMAASRSLAMVVMTADPIFASAVSDRVLTLAPATGALTGAGGWRGWLTRAGGRRG